MEKKIVKIKFSQLVPDKKNVRTDMEEIEDLADSIQNNGQEKPIDIEDLENGKFLVSDGHRRYYAFEILKKRTGKDPLIDAIIVHKLTDQERLIKRCVIDAQTKNLTPEERDAAWKKVWDTGKYKRGIADEKEFRKILGTTPKNVSDFFDRQQLDPSIKKMFSEQDKKGEQGYAGILQETRSLKGKTRDKVLKYAAKTGKGAMAIRQDVKVLKDASEDLVDAFANEEINIGDAEKFKSLDEEKRKQAVATIKYMKQKTAQVSDVLSKKELNSENVDPKKKEIQERIDEIKDTIGETTSQLEKIRWLLSQIRENSELEKRFPVTIKRQIAGCLTDLDISIEKSSENIKHFIAEWS